MFNKSHAGLFLTVFLACLAFTSSAFSQESGKIDPLKFFDEHKRWYRGNTEAWFYFFDIPEAEVRKSIEHWEEIGKDLKNLDSSLTKGHYGIGGETHGSYLRWSQEKGFIWLHVDFCQGGPMRILRGRAEIVPEGVVLIPDIVLGSSGGHGGGHGENSNQPKQFRMVAIMWMDAVYLVQREQLADFADYSAGLGDYNRHSPYLGDNPFLTMGIGGETNGATYSPPVYPRGLERYHKQPIRGSITSIAKSRRVLDPESDAFDRLVTPIKIRLERTTDLKSPIKLIAVAQDLDFDEEFELKSVQGNIATVEHSRPITKRNCVAITSGDCKDPDHLKLRVGMVLSSNGL